MLTSLTGRLRRTRERSDAGITLVEMVVSMSLMTIIGSMAVTFFVGMNRASTATTDANLSTAGARTVLDSWTSLLRVADSPTKPGDAGGRIVTITPTEIQFYADVNNRACSSTCGAATHPTKVDLSLTSGSLVEKRFVYANGAYPSTPTSTDTLASGASTSGWLFTPYVNGNPPTPTLPALCPGGTAGICTGTTGASAVLDTIVRIDISFAIQTDGGNTAQRFTASSALPGATS
jgi:type II secretory pathway pseudopilin PulG